VRPSPASVGNTPVMALDDRRGQQAKRAAMPLLPPYHGAVAGHIQPHTTSLRSPTDCMGPLYR
jgi:hypothetical protein